MVADVNQMPSSAIQDVFDLMGPVQLIRCGAISGEDAQEPSYFPESFIGAEEGTSRANRRLRVHPEGAQGAR